MKSICAKLLFVPAAVLLGSLGCQTEEVRGVCKVDGDCPNAEFYCGPDYQCLCKSDKACGEDEFCNSSNHCQKHMGCRQDSDCGDPVANVRCQIDSEGSGSCLCRNDQACKSGEFCNTSGQCQKKAGCMLDADCRDPVLFRCLINPETKIGECLCNSEAACKEDEFCNSKGYCQPNANCKSVADCPAGRICDDRTGECLCNHEAQTGCNADEECNPSGYCQPRSGCFDNGDCNPGTFCDLETRSCLSAGTCTNDRQCDFGQVCFQNACSNGCRGNADCFLDQFCGSDFVCAQGCQADNFCAPPDYRIAESCEQKGAERNCLNKYTPETPYCKPCNSSSPLWQCGAGANWCVIYPYLDDGFGSEEYCGIATEKGGRCPNGFDSFPLSVIEGECTSEAQCPDNVPCEKAPEEDKGFCPCHDQYNPCPANICVGPPIMVPGTCFVTGKSCRSGSDCPDPVCDYKDENGFGGCVIGYACGVREGVHCKARARDQILQARQPKNTKFLRPFSDSVENGVRLISRSL